MKKLGFTLVELLVVIAIIGILAGLIVLGLRQSRSHAYDANRKTDIAQIARALEAYAAENGEKYPISEDDSSQCGAPRGNVEKLSNSSCSGKQLVDGGYLSTVPLDPVYIGDLGYYLYYNPNGDENFILQFQMQGRNGYVYQRTSRGSTEKPGNGSDAICPDEQRVLIVVNDNSPESVAVGNYYQQRRNVPSNQIVHINTTTDLYITEANYNSQIKDPIKEFLGANDLRGKIYYIVTTYGMPYKTSEAGYGVDSLLADLDDKTTKISSGYWPYNYGYNNPYRKVFMTTYRNGNHSSGTKYDSQLGIYLVMRLDGPSPAIAKGLVDKALYAAKYVGINSGKGYMVHQPYLMSTDGSAYSNIEGAITKLCEPILAAGYQCVRDSAHAGGPNPLWHVSPGDEYRNSWDTLPPGAIPMHFQSSTAINTIRSTASNKPIVPNLLAADATGTWGSTAEPYASFIPQPTALHNYFLNGNKSIGVNHFNLAQSLYQSVYSLKWRWVPIGDPLYILPNTAAADNERPKITNLQQSRNGATITVSWDNFTSESGSPEVTYGAVEYGTTPDYGSIVWDESRLEYFNISKKNYFSQHSITINNLDPTQTYYLRIKAIDPAGNESSQTLTL